MSFICGGGPAAPTADGLWPDTGLDEPCCEGSAFDGPGHCTCWEPVYNLTQQQPDKTAVRLLAAGVAPTVRPGGMCGDCAYRPGSPEKSGDPTFNGDADFLEEIAERGERFWCHDGNLIVVKWRHPKSGMEMPGHPGAYKPPIVNAVPYKADGTPSYLCAGWDARRRALEAKRK